MHCLLPNLMKKLGERNMESPSILWYFHIWHSSLPLLTRTSHYATPVLVTHAIKVILELKSIIGILWISYFLSFCKTLQYYRNPAMDSSLPNIIRSSSFYTYMANPTRSIFIFVITHLPFNIGAFSSFYASPS